MHTAHAARVTRLSISSTVGLLATILAALAIAPQSARAIITEMSGPVTVNGGWNWGFYNMVGGVSFTTGSFPGNPGNRNLVQVDSLGRFYYGAGTYTNPG